MGPCVLSYSENVYSAPPEPLYQDNGISSSAFEVAEVQWTPAQAPRAQGQALASEEEQYEAGYSTRTGTAPELDTDRWERLVSMWFNDMIFFLNHSEKISGKSCL